MSTGGNIDFQATKAARVWIEATYYYCPNLAPECGPDFAETPEATPVEIDVLANDMDPDGQIDCTTLAIVAGSGPSNGTAIVPAACASAGSCPDSNCRIIYTPNVGFCGVDTFNYEVMDDDGALMMSCPVTVTVLPVNEPPVANDDVASTPEGIPVLVDVCANDSDPDALSGCGDDIDCNTGGQANNPLTIISQPDCGGSAFVLFHQPSQTWQIRVNPPRDYCGPCTLTYTIKDTGTPQLESNVATVTLNITPVNSPPVAIDDFAMTPESTPVVIDVCMNDSDPDGGTSCGDDIDCSTASPNPLTIVSQPDCGGSAVVISNGGQWRVRFDPPAGFCGTCQFTYTVDDTGTPALTSNVATVTVTVDPVNEPPVAANDSATTPEATPVLIDVCLNDSDPDDATGCGDPLDCSIPGANPITIISQPDCGGNAVVVFNTGRWRVRFDPPAGFCGVCQFTYTVDDTGAPALTSNVATVTVTVDPVNEPPVASDDKESSIGGAPVLIDVCANDSDPDDGTGCGDPLNCNDNTSNPIQLGAQPPCGNFATIFNGGRWQVRYDPAAGFCGECVITYTVTDEGGLVSNVATITVNVTLDNNPPIANDDSASTPEDMPVQIPVLANDTDPDSKPCGSPIDPGSVVIISAPDPTCGTVNAGPYPGGVVTFTPAPGFCGQCTFTYRMCDTAKVPLCDTAVVTVTVTPVNDCPIAEDDSAETNVGVPIDIDVCANDHDPDAENSCGGDIDCTTVTVISQPDCGGTAVELGDGQVRFTPPPGFIGNCCFTYVVSDSADRPCMSNIATVCVNVVEVPCDAENRRAPGSLLLFPEFDNREGVVSIFTVTNTGNRDVQVEYVYRRQEDCLEFNRKEDLTANDTLTLITNYHNPNHNRGFAYVFAQCPQSNEAVSFNKLIGQVLVVDGLESFSYGINAVVFRGIGDGSDAECTTMPLTDLNGNGKRDLDGLEYAMAPGSIHIPRFVGQTDSYSSELILVSLSGGPYFTTTLDFLIYNDNEEEFSSEFSFSCWDRVPLLDVSMLFAADFLALSTNNNPLEVLGDPTMETGWMRIDGDVAVSSATTIYDPAFYAVLVEMVAQDRYVADLPFEDCTQGNGVLLPNGTNGL